MADHGISSHRLKGGKQVSFRWTQLPARLSLYSDELRLQDAGWPSVSEKKIYGLEIGASGYLTFFDSAGVELKQSLDVHIKDLTKAGGGFPEEIQQKMSPHLVVRVTAVEGQITVYNSGANIAISNVGNLTRIDSFDAFVVSGLSNKSVFPERQKKVYSCGHQASQRAYCQQHRSLKP